MAEHVSAFKRIWRPFIMLFLITVAEFIVAFTLVPKEEYTTVRAIIFLVMTIVKAFYIVAFFMHLKFERVHLMYTIVLPMAFVVYLIVLMFNEGGAVHEAHQTNPTDFLLPTTN
jgi:cytochrome c oxidase subunit IV